LRISGVGWWGTSGGCNSSGVDNPGKILRKKKGKKIKIWEGFRPSLTKLKELKVSVGKEGRGETGASKT